MAPDPKPPFRKINFLSRKAKDARGLAAVKDHDASYTIRSKGKVNDPNTGAPLARGSQVTSHTSKTISRTPDTVVAGKTETRSTPTTIEKFTPGDRNPDKINDRMTTPELGKSLKESPAKTQTRMNIQSAVGAGKKPEDVGAKRVGNAVAYDHGKFKNEYAGRFDKATVVKTETIKKPDTVIPGKLQTSTNRKITVNTPKNKPSGSSGGGGITVQRVAGVNNKGQGQNYKQLKVGSLPLAKWRTKTHGSGR